MTRTSEEPHYQEMSSVSRLLGQPNVAEGEHFQARVGAARASGIDGKQDDPSDEHAAFEISMHSIIAMGQTDKGAKISIMRKRKRTKT